MKFFEIRSFHGSLRYFLTTSWKRQRTKDQALSTSSSCHHQPNLIVTRGFRIHFADEPAVVNHQQPIRQGGHFLQFGRHQENRATGITQSDNFAMNEFDGADIYAPRWL